MHIVKRLAFFVTRQAKVLERWQIVWKILVLPNKSPRSDPPGEKKASSLRFASSLIHFPGPSLLKAFVCQASPFFFFVFVFPPIPSFQLLMMLSSRKVQASQQKLLILGKTASLYHQRISSLTHFCNFWTASLRVNDNVEKETNEPLELETKRRNIVQEVSLRKTFK